MAEATTTQTAAKTKPAKLPQVEKGVKVSFAGVLESAMKWKKNPVPGETGEGHVITIGTTGATDFVAVPQHLMRIWEAASQFGGLPVLVNTYRVGSGQYATYVLESIEQVELVDKIREYNPSDFAQFVNS